MFIPSRGELIAAVELAGRHIRNNFGRPLTIHHKEDNTPVTEIDLRINAELAKFADKMRIGFIGEEGNGNGHSHTYLYVDPLDGTGAFTRGIATATVVASVMFEGSPIMAVIHNPLTLETWFAKQGKGTTYSRDGQSARMISVDTETPKYWRTAICSWPGVDQQFADFQKRVIDNSDFSDQPMGAFATGGGLLASGLIHATAISATSAVETAAMSLIVKEAGGVAIDLHRNPLDSFELGEHKGKADFLLPRGAIMACNQEVANWLSHLYNEL